MLERSGAFFFLTVWPIHQTNEGSVGKDQGPRKFMYGGAEHFFLFLFFLYFTAVSFYCCFFLLLYGMAMPKLLKQQDDETLMSEALTFKCLSV